MGGAEMITFLAPPLMCLSYHSEPIPSTQCHSGLEGIGATWRPLHHRPVTSARAHSVTMHKRTRNKAGQYGSNGNVGQVRLGCKQLGLALLGEDTSGPNQSINPKSTCKASDRRPTSTYRVTNDSGQPLKQTGSQTRTRTQHRWHPRGWRPGPGVGHSCRRKANLSIASHNSEGIPSAGTQCKTSHDGAQGSTFSWKTAISTPLTTRNLKKGSPSPRPKC